MAIKDSIAFGIGDQEAAGLTTTESVSITTRIDKTEGYKENGEYACVRFYNPHGEFTATGYGITTAKALISALTTASDLASLDPDDNTTGLSNTKIFVLTTDTFASFFASLVSSCSVWSLLVSQSLVAYCRFSF